MNETTSGNERKACGAFLLLLAAALLAICLCSSCKTVEYVPVETVRETVRTDTLREIRLRVDSVVSRDSVEVYVNGDTVRIKQKVYRDRIVTRTDTVWRKSEKSDSVSEPKVIVREKELTAWQTARMAMGDVLVGFVLLFFPVVFLLNWIKKKIR